MPRISRQPEPQKSGDARTPLEQTFTYRLHQLAKLTDQAGQNTYRALTGMQISDVRCLTAIGNFEPLSIMDLATLANLNKGQASRAAQALADRGLVRKEGRPDDGRGVILTLTPAGRKCCDQVMEVVRMRNEQICACLDAQERQTFSDLLDRLIEHARHS